MAAIPIIIQAQKMSHLQQQQLKDDIAWQLFGEVTLQQAKWRDTVIQHSSSISLRERRVRLALATNDMVSLAQWLKRLGRDSDFYYLPFLVPRLTNCFSMLA